MGARAAAVNGDAQIIESGLDDPPGGLLYEQRSVGGDNDAIRDLFSPRDFDELGHVPIHQGLAHHVKIKGLDPAHRLDLIADAVEALQIHSRQPAARNPQTIPDNRRT